MDNKFSFENEKLNLNLVGFLDVSKNDYPEKSHVEPSVSYDLKRCVRKRLI